MCAIFIRLAAIIVVLALLPSPSVAITLYGPSLYRSVADSPFDLSRPAGQFFLEDFEDGAIDTPGLISRISDGQNAGVRLPGIHTDSVDADDGTSDGFGSQGHSLVSIVLTIGEGPSSAFVDARFDSDSLGFHPTHLGLVITDANSRGEFTLHVQDSVGNEFAFPLNALTGPDGVGIGGIIYDGFAAAGSNATDDLFFGIVHTTGITAFSLSYFDPGGNGDAFEIDHIQYGVPEPSSVGLAIATLLCFALGVRRGARHQKGVRSHFQAPLATNRP
jgi:hypothetical protein